MPDCSAVTINAYFDDDLDGYAIAAVIATAYERLLDGASTIDTYADDAATAKQYGHATIEDYDAPWGINAAEDALSFLEAICVPYTADDAGHYTWSPTTRMYAPGMADEYQRETCATVDGGSLFSAHEVELYGVEWCRTMSDANPVAHINWKE